MLEHSWDVSVKEATVIQKRLRESVRLEPLVRSTATIAGADISFERFSDEFFAAIVVLSFPDLVPIARSFARVRVGFPYVPGYLSFREVPALAQAYAALAVKPDVIMMDGHGIAHPRRIGVAAHLGLMLDVPAFGCAKTRLYGEGALPDEVPGATSPLSDPKTGETIGSYLHTKARSKPVIISAGHRITLEECVALAHGSVRGYRLPEPTRQAHELANALRRGEIAPR